MKMASCREYCGGSRNGKKLQYVIGDAMTDSSDCLGPDGKPYPMYVIVKLPFLQYCEIQSKILNRKRSQIPVSCMVYDISELKSDRYCLD